MDHKQLDAAGASSSATNVYCSALEELQHPVAVTSDIVCASARERWTLVDYTTEIEDDYKFVRTFPGKDIRKYEREHINLLEQINQGGQGTIYRAQVYNHNPASGEYEPSDERTVAKMYRGRNCGQWPEEVLGLHLSSVHICRFHGYCINGDSFILVMKEYDCSLRDALDRRMKMRKWGFRRRPLPDFYTVNIIIEIALGINFLHEKGILHRDLKADNIFVQLEPTGVPMLAVIGDFDVAPNVVGTLFWRAPEVLQALREGKRPIFTPQTDVYSFAMVCYEVLTGAIPFDGVRASDYDTVICGKRPRLPSNLNPKMKDFLSRCWHQDPCMRPSSQEIVEELQVLHREFFTGCDILSSSTDNFIEASFCSIDKVEANRESCLMELKELLQVLDMKYNQADLLALGFDVVADMEQFHSIYGLQSLNRQRQHPVSYSYSQWFQRVILLDQINWKIQLFSRSVPNIHEVSKLYFLMMQIMYSEVEYDEFTNESSVTDDEMAARDAEVLAWIESRENRVLPENPHRACLDQCLHQLGKGSSGDDGFQACDVCSDAFDAFMRSRESSTSSLYVNNGLFILSSLQGMFHSLS